jgi:hypothetical protein
MLDTWLGVNGWLLDQYSPLCRFSIPATKLERGQMKDMEVNDQ